MNSHMFGGAPFGSMLGNRVSMRRDGLGQELPGGPIPPVPPSVPAQIPAVPETLPATPVTPFGNSVPGWWSGPPWRRKKRS